MQRNYERWQWNDEAGQSWRCEVCKARPEAATHRGRDGEVEQPYNFSQKYCSEACARLAKTIKQRIRREDQRREQRAEQAAREAQERAREEQARRDREREEHARQRGGRRRRGFDDPFPPLAGRAEAPADVTRQIDRLRKLWALATKNGEPHEAARAREMAHELVRKHGEKLRSFFDLSAIDGATASASA